MIIPKTTAKSWMFAFFLSVSPVTAAYGQMILSSDRGEPASLVDLPEPYQNPDDVREYLEADLRNGEQMASEFYRVCVSTKLDKALYDELMNQEGSQFKKKMIVLKPQGKRAEVSFEAYKSATVLSSLWVGDKGDELEGRYHFVRSRGALITGPFKAEKFYAPQCNYSIRSFNLKSGEQMASNLQTLIGKPADKLVLKEGFADGYWYLELPEGRNGRIAFSIVDLKKDEQLVHMSYQMLPAKKKK